MEQPAEGPDVDLSEIFSQDKIAFNARNLNYWCAGRAASAPLAIPTLTAEPAVPAAEPVVRPRVPALPSIRCPALGGDVRHHGPGGPRGICRILSLNNAAVARDVLEDELRSSPVLQEERRRLGRGRRASDDGTPRRAWRTAACTPAAKRALHSHILICPAPGAAADSRYACPHRRTCYFGHYSTTSCTSTDRACPPPVRVLHG
jgi:hypothetical protein